MEDVELHIGLCALTVKKWEIHGRVRTRKAKTFKMLISSWGEEKGGSRHSESNKNLPSKILKDEPVFHAIQINL